MILKVLLGIFVLGILVVLGAAFAGFIFFSRGGTETAAVSNAQSTPTPSAMSENRTDQNNELRDQIANLEKRLNAEQKKSAAVNIPLTTAERSGSWSTARVDSPVDGFLALRTLPNSELGERIQKIPHGATVSVGACGPVVRPVKRSGRWCRATYNGYSGWVFDAYLIY
jgi:hypothetical protein